MGDARPATAPVLVAGGGWAGLSAALTLCRHQVPVILVESARQLGGRARSVRSGERILDNGQHLMIGAYQALLTLMKQIGIDVDAAFQRLPLTLQLYRDDAVSLRFRAPTLPAPFHLLGALSAARGLSASERLRALRFSRKVTQLRISAAEDFSVQALLHSHAQSPGLVRKLWEPLCLASLNTPIDLASARLFTRVLQTLFSGSRPDSDLLIPRQELNALLPRPAGEFLEDHGAGVELGQRLTGLEIDAQAIRGAIVGGRRLAASHVILATPHSITRRLLSRHPVLQPLAARLGELGHEPIATVYLQYPPEIALDPIMVGLESGLAQWVFDRRCGGQPGLIAAVISGRGPHQRLPATTLIDAVVAQLKEHFPHWPPPLERRLIREKRATFCARAGIDTWRPANRTPVAGLWLAGDYTATDLPATLEGAVRSGNQCALQLMQSLSETNVVNWVDAHP